MIEEDREKIIDVKGTLESFVEEEQPEISQEEAIKKYTEHISNKKDKQKRFSENESSDDENEDDEHLKRVKKELLASLERVNEMSHRIFDEKEKSKDIKDVKIKSESQKSKNKEQTLKQNKEQTEEKENEKSRE